MRTYAFWLREDVTVKGARGNIWPEIQKADIFHGDIILPVLRPLPLKDVDGMGVTAL
jgi:hypothetical protein